MSGLVPMLRKCIKTIYVANYLNCNIFTDKNNKCHFPPIDNVLEVCTLF